MNNKLSTEQIHKEIDLIQACIERMSKNSFACKSWNLTLIAGIFALSAENINKKYLYIIVLCINLCFWWLDSFYVLQERKYRDKYEWVIFKRPQGNSKYLYDLNPKNKNMNLRDKKRNQIKTAFSLTLFPMYGGITILIIVFILIKIHGGI